MSLHVTKTSLKVCHEQTQQTHPDKLTVGRDSINSHLAILGNLTQGIISSSEVIQDNAPEAASDIIKAAVELNAAIRQVKKPFSSDTDPDPDSTGKRPECASTPHNLERSDIPALPPISDELLEQAVFTHPGVGNDPKLTYDRLEILGDAYVELIATKIIWGRCPDLPSGRMSQIREMLVKNETLSEFAAMYGFDRKASVPKDYLRQPKRWIKTKADIFEAYVAAVILSNPITGYSFMEEWLSRLWVPKLADLDCTSLPLQAKEELAKRVMGKRVKLRYIDERAPVLNGGTQTFYIGVYLTGWGWKDQHLGSGQGPNKTIAGDQAARAALLNMPLIDQVAAAKKAWYAKDVE